MKLPDKELFLEELELINNVDIKNDLILLYEHLIGKTYCNTPSVFAFKTLEKMFKNNLVNEFSIPASFLNTNVGNVIFKALFCDDTEVELTTNDVAVALGLTRQYVWQIREELGGYKKDGTWYFKKSSIEKYKNKEK